MQDHDLRRTAESLWSAWLDLSYAFADLNDKGDSQSVRLGLGVGIEKLRLVAEMIDRAAKATPRRPPTDASTNASATLVEGVLRVAG